MTKQLKDSFAAKLEQSGLTLKDADKLRMRPVTADDCRTFKLPPYEGFIIPYFDSTGKASDFYRIRYLSKTQSGFAALTTAKPLRYVQPKGSLSEVYLPPLVDWAKIVQDPKRPIIITEGELKAAKACKEGFATMGLGGVWNFKSAAHNIELLKVLNSGVSWEGRTVVIVYDSDAITNAKVALAEHTLAKLLLKRGADVRIGRIMAGGDAKVGVDDLLVAGGKAALREVLDAAAPFAGAEPLFKLNTEVIYVRNPGLILRLGNLQRMAARAFTEHAYATRTYVETLTVETAKGVQVKSTEKSAPKEWLKWPFRSEVEKVVYEPGCERITEGCLNLWPGWGCVPAEGLMSPWHNLMDWMFKGDEDARIWFEQWCAYPMQFPGTKLYQSCVFWGIHHGTGKSLIGYTLFKIYGQNATEIKDSDLHANHNEWAENKQFIMGDEITGGDKRGSADRMKSLITQERLRLNPKYVPSYDVKDCINYYFTSNHPDSVFLEDNDRRYFIWEVDQAPLQRKFYNDYGTWLNNGGPAALFNYLLNMNLTGFDPKAPPPMTIAKQQMMHSGKSDLARWVQSLREDLDGTLQLDGIKLKYALYRAEDLLRVYDPGINTRVTINGLARELKKGGFNQVYRGMPVRTAIGQVRLWAIREKEEKYAAMVGDDIGRLYSDERGLNTKMSRRKF